MTQKLLENSGKLKGGVIKGVSSVSAAGIPGQSAAGSG